MTVSRYLFNETASNVSRELSLLVRFNCRDSWEVIASNLTGE